jgi:penicillin-binding protein 2
MSPNVSRLEKINEIELAELKQRINIATAVILVFVLILVSRLWFLQILRGADYDLLSENNRVRGQTIVAPRGNVLDRNGEVLLSNRPYFNVTWMREDAANPEEVLKKTAGILNVDINELLDRVREGADYPRYIPIRLKEDIDWKRLVYIENHQYDLPGIRIEVLPSRDYINKNLASHLLGYLGSINKQELIDLYDKNYRADDQIGRTGLEKLYEDQLRGEKGHRYVEIDAQGFEQQELNVQEPLPGNDIQLTLDIGLQKTAEQALVGTAGAVVVLNVKDGQVLALASSPPLELEEFIGGISSKAWKAMQENPFKPFTNKAIQGQYPPGSTYKIITALAGLSEKVIDSDTISYCNGSIKLHGRRYNCWKRGGHGAVNLKKALAESCDVYFYQVGLKLGVDKLARYAQSMGLGAATGIELEHEKSGLVPTAEWKKQWRKEIWQEGETLSTAIGQGFNLATPLQICQATAAVSNGGTLYRPQLIKEIRGPEGEIIEEFKPVEVGRALGSKETYRLIKEGMIAAVKDKHGTAGVMKMEGVTVAGKTGTAQVVKLAQYRHLAEESIPYKYRDHAWITGFAPAEDPEIAVTVLIEHGLHGASGAGPVAKKVLEAYFKTEQTAEKKDVSD